MSNRKDGFFIVRQIKRDDEKEIRASNFSNAKRSAKRMQESDETVIVESLDGQRVSLLCDGKWFDYELRDKDE